MRSRKYLLFIGLWLIASHALPAFAQQTEDVETSTPLPTTDTAAPEPVPALGLVPVPEPSLSTEVEQDTPAAEQTDDSLSPTKRLTYQPSESAMKFELGIDYRLRGIYLTKFPIDETELLDTRSYLEHRLRLMPEVSREHYSFKGIFDVHQGPIAGDTDEPPSNTTSATATAPPAFRSTAAATGQTSTRMSA
jgi:hypothetical protein